jgi:hypothetical protein
LSHVIASATVNGTLVSRQHLPHWVQPKRISML